MSFRPDAPAFTAPALLTDPPIVGVSTDDEPELDADGGDLEVGMTWFQTDTGSRYYWTGDEWKSVTVEQVEALKLALSFEIRDRLDALLGNYD